MSTQSLTLKQKLPGVTASYHAPHPFKRQWLMSFKLKNYFNQSQLFQYLRYKAAKPLKLQSTKSCLQFRNTFLFVTLSGTLSNCIFASLSILHVMFLQIQIFKHLLSQNVSICYFVAFLIQSSNHSSSNDTESSLLPEKPRYKK